VRALVITEHGPPEVLRVQERPDPEPGRDEVRVRVRAAGVNFADLLARVGLYPEAPKPPCVVGYEFAGEVETPGGAFRAGQRVLGGCRFGGYAELVATPASNLVALPDDWTFAEGAALPVNYATAYAGLVRYGNVRPGERVLVQAAAGGVGIAATQVAKLLGAEVFGTASPEKHEAIRSFGVDHAIDYRKRDFADEVRRTAGEERPLDLVLDAVGGRSFRRGFSLLRTGGRLVCFGVSGMQSGERRSRLRAVRVVAQMPRFNAMRLMTASKSVIGLNMLAVWDAKGSLDEFIDPLSSWLDEGSIRPVVAREFPLEQGSEAHRFIHERRNVGKVVLSP
jgi:NADPH:quinone reductase-like Zn-dependent oxidoreductase